MHSLNALGGGAPLHEAASSRCVLSVERCIDLTQRHTTKDFCFQINSFLFFNVLRSRACTEVTPHLVKQVEGGAKQGLEPEQQRQARCCLLASTQASSKAPDALRGLGVHADALLVQAQRVPAEAQVGLALVRQVPVCLAKRPAKLLKGPAMVLKSSTKGYNAKRTSQA